MISFFTHLFDTRGFVPRWICGQWSEGLGWLHVVSDVAIFGAYAAIPLMLIYFIRQRKEVPFSPILWLFAAFILSCGCTHLVEATLFWHPWYRLSGLLKVVTALVSWLTVFALFKAIPVALSLPGRAKMNDQLLAEIAERKHAEEALQVSEASLRKRTEELETLLDALPAFVWITQDTNCSLITGNRAANQLTGTQSGENVSQTAAVEGKAVYLKQLKEDGTEYRVDELPLQRAIATGKPVLDALLDFRFPDGRIVKVFGNAVPLFDEQGSPRGAVAAFHDVTTLKQAEVELRESGERIRALADSISQLAWMAQADGFIHWYNQRWYDYTGTTPQAMEGWGWQSVHDPEKLPEVLVSWKEAIATGESFEMIFPLRGADGKFRSFLTRAVPLKDASGQVTQWFGTNTDVDELKQTELALEEAKQAAEAANLSKDRFLAMISHELRTPLNPALMAISLIEMEPGLSEEAREDVAMIKRNLEMEVKLIDDLLDISKITMGKMVLQLAQVDLNAVIQDVCKICQQTISEKNVQLEMALAEELEPFSADPARLRQILWNLVRNAVKFTPDGGTIRISSARLVTGGYEVRVQDSGIGISAENLSLIFAAFEQGDTHITRKFGGLGLGLAICKALVELHGGSIRAESAGVGRGATFIVELWS